MLHMKGELKFVTNLHLSFTTTLVIVLLNWEESDGINRECIDLLYGLASLYDHKCFCPVDREGQ